MARTTVKRHNRKGKPVRKHTRKVKKRSIDLKDIKKHPFGSVAWQEAQEYNIRQKLIHSEDLGPAETSFLRIQKQKYIPEVGPTSKVTKRKLGKRKLKVRKRRYPGKHLILSDEEREYIIDTYGEEPENLPYYEVEEAIEERREMF